ncbi:hypothetical protein [Frigoribacterium sp. PhB24]|uniref:hypothetical protein n=1 Tax=Frigoribacterium sp. PhB24 TaxID=2485204 RepID=UPI000F46E492|nr:hypothetical protein [Frigoribacterium sp. PhB24]ROS52945.1 hypothetical protein EDF50_1422 [Frigoribacterium sp. PhB24]
MTDSNVTKIPTRYGGESDNPSAALVGTCDFGGGMECDEETLAVVRNFDTGEPAWISMCARHAIESLGGYTQGDVESWAD